MAFGVPNQASAGYAPQADIDAVDFTVLVQGMRGEGVLDTGNLCAVTAQGTPDMTVAVASGVVRSGGISKTVTAGNVTIAAADGSNPRFDLIVADSTGAKQRRGGTAAAHPVFPTPTAGDVVLAAVYVPTSDTTIGSDQITDKRVFLPDDRGESVEWSSATAPAWGGIEDGGAISRTTYSGLFDKIGTAFGVGDGSTTFNVPDSRLKVPMGAKAETVPVIASKAQSTGTEAAGVTATLPSGVADGDLLIAIVTSASGAGQDPITPKGWTLIDSIGIGVAEPQLRTFYRWANKEPASYVFPNGNSATIGMTVEMLRITGADPTTPINAHGTTARQAGGTTFVVSGLTTTVDSCLVLQVAAMASAAVVTSTDTNTEEWDFGTDPGTASSQSGASKTQTTAGASGTCTFTPSATPTSYVGAALAIAPLQSALGKSGGKNLHGHVDPSHSHTLQTVSNAAGGGAAMHVTVAATGTETPGLDSQSSLQPYIAKNKVIRY